MTRTRPDQPDDLETATDVKAETAETAAARDVGDDMAPPDEATREGTADQAAEEPQAKRYRVVRGQVAYPDGSGGEKRADEGDEIDDISDEDAAWLVADGILERI